MHNRQPIFIAAFGVLIVIIAGLTIEVTTFTERVSLWRDRQWLGIDDFKQFLGEDVADLIAKDQPITLIGDARAFWYPLPTSKLHYRTVFDVRGTGNVVEAWREGETVTS